MTTDARYGAHTGPREPERQRIAEEMRRVNVLASVNEIRERMHRLEEPDCEYDLGDLKKVRLLEDIHIMIEAFDEAMRMVAVANVEIRRLRMLRRKKYEPGDDPGEEEVSE
jgi:hypothetical protein